MKIPIPFYESIYELNLPDQWDVTVCLPTHLPVLGEKQLQIAFKNPFGTSQLRELAKGKKTAAILVEDITRPTRLERLVPLVLKELHAAGICAEHILIVSATGCHRPLSGPDFRHRLGEEIVDRYRVINPNPYADFMELGKTSRGTPVRVPAEIYNYDIKIGVGSIIPHGRAGFGGGAKIVMPGVCSFETIAHHHLTLKPDKSNFGVVDGNDFRDDLEEIARMFTLDFLVNSIISVDRNIVGLFCGDVIEAHRQGVQLARKAYSVQAPGNADAAIIGAYPEDFDLQQATKALSKNMGSKSVREDGNLLLLAACPDGAGYNMLYGPLGRGYDYFKTRIARMIDRKVIIFSPGAGFRELLEVFPSSVTITSDIDRALKMVTAGIGSPRINVFPYGGLSMVKLM